MPIADLSARLAAIVIALVAALALPAAASAARVEVQGITAVYTARAGEKNDVRVSSTPTAVEIRDRVPLFASRGCVNLDPTRVLCAQAFALTASLGDRSDNVSNGSAIPIQLDGGPGDDQLGTGHGKAPSLVQFAGGPGIDLVDYGSATGPVFVHKDGAAFDGRRGDHDNIAGDVEEITGSQFADVLSGNASAETFQGRGGADLVLAGGGDDRFLAEDFSDGADKISGGAGIDTVSYARRGQGVQVTPDVGGADDGAADERDEIVQAEVIQGGAGRDNLVASASPPERGYTLHGLGEDDFVIGGRGSDRLNGGPGHDRMDGLGGDDELDSRDGVAEVLACGEGIDVALVDPVTSPGSGLGGGAGGRDQTFACESHPNVVVGTARVEPVGFDDGVATVRVSWTHPRRWSDLRRVTVRLRDGDRVVGRRSFVPHAGKGHRVTRRMRVPVPAARSGDVLAAAIRATDRRGRHQTVQLPAAVVL
jgi:RTX calcium-binding nonapeptide repeat (4 copies)